MPRAKLGRTIDHRRATFRAMVTALLEHEKIETTEAKAKEINALTDEMITLGKQNDLHARREVLAFLTDESVAKKLFENIAPRYTDRSGGYTRIMKIGPRRGDAAPMVIIELV
jgi:large subunit ribosomal protein L17